MSENTERLAEICDRLSATRPGLWLVNDEEQTVRVESEDGGEWGGEIMYDRSAEHPNCWVAEFRPDAAFIANAPTDIAYLLDLVRKQGAAIGAVAKVVDEKYRIWAAICGNTCSKDIIGVDHDAIADEIANVIHESIREALDAK